MWFWSQNSLRTARARHDGCRKKPPAIGVPYRPNVVSDGVGSLRMAGTDALGSRPWGVVCQCAVRF